VVSDVAGCMSRKTRARQFRSISGIVQAWNIHRVYRVNSCIRFLIDRDTSEGHVYKVLAFIVYTGTSEGDPGDIKGI